MKLHRCTTCDEVADLRDEVTTLTQQNSHLRQQLRESDARVSYVAQQLRDHRLAAVNPADHALISRTELIELRSQQERRELVEEQLYRALALLERAGVELEP